MIDRIIQITCNNWHVTYEDVLSCKRNRPLPFARMMIARFLRKNTSLTITEIGNILHKQHTSILYYLRLYDTEYNLNKEFHTIAEKVKSDYQREMAYLTLELEEEFNEIRG